MGGVRAGIPSDQVVAVVAYLNSGLVQTGSGYLVTGRRVLTARHCTVDKKTGRPARSLQVVRRSDGAKAPATPFAATGDVALITVEESPEWAVPTSLEPPLFGRVDRSRSGELRDCEAIGFPLWQLDPKDQQRNAAELHGTIRVTEDVESGLLVMRDSLLDDVVIPRTAATKDRAEESEWGGLSGALVFYQGIALGVVIEHHPRQGSSAITILPVERFAAVPAREDPDRAAVAEALGLPAADKLPLAGRWSLTELVDVLVHGRLPQLDALDPYTLGATTSIYGNAETYGQHDEYVSRTKDEQLAAALRAGKMVILTGPSKAGKTRSAFEVLRKHRDWSSALLAVPAPGSLRQLPGHPGLVNSRSVVIWLDDLPRFLPPNGELSQAIISRLLDRRGPTVLLATLRTEQRELLRGREGELTRDVRMVLDHAVEIELASTREDPDEQARAVTAYPQLSSLPEGLAEMLASAPELLRRYHDAASADPVLHSLVQTSVDWARCGLARPIAERDLIDFAWNTLEQNRPDLDPDYGEFGSALRRARRAAAARGQAALLSTHRLSGDSRGYWAFEYLVAADDGQDNRPVRPVADTTWRRFLARASNDDAFNIGAAAYWRDNDAIALVATRQAAESGNARAQSNLGVLLATTVDPPELAEARRWYAQAAEAGDTWAQHNLGLLLAAMVDPPELAEARRWYAQAAEAGITQAQANLGQLLATMVDPPELAEARRWLTQAADAGNTRAQHDLGQLLATMVDPPELAEARRWLTQAADAGNTRAQHDLGQLLATMVDPPELAEARRWLTQAADAGNIDAQVDLGVVLASRLDPPELAEARRWLTHAAEAGNTGAQVGLAALASQMDPPELAEARRWLTQAAEAGDTEAQLRLGLLLGGMLEPKELVVGRHLLTHVAEAVNDDPQGKLGVLFGTMVDPLDLADARRWLTQAAEAGNTDAQHSLGVLLATRLHPPELAEARRWLTQAAESGNTAAQYSLGVRLATMVDPPELAEARRWLTQAAEAGHTQAQADLGLLLDQYSDPPELAEARRWYTQAAQAGYIPAQYNLAVLLASRIEPPELAEARAWLTQASEAGDVSSQYDLGVLLATMLDPPELTEARAWWARAASAGYVAARRALESSGGG